VAETVTDEDVDVALLLQDPRAALFPMLTKVRGWEEVSTPEHRIKSSIAGVSASTSSPGTNVQGLQACCFTAKGIPARTNGNRGAAVHTGDAGRHKGVPAIRGDDEPHLPLPLPARRRGNHMRMPDPCLHVHRARVMQTRKSAVRPLPGCRYIHMAG
jgi:hypothetical protein